MSYHSPKNQIEFARVSYCSSSSSSSSRVIGGATPKFLGGPNLRPTTDVLQTIYGI